MRIILFVANFSVGGAEQVAILLASGLVELGHDVHIVAANLKGGFLERVNPACQLHDLRSSRPIRARRQLAYVVDQISPDAIVCFGFATGIAAALSRLTWMRRPTLVIRNESNLEQAWGRAKAHNRIIGPLLSRWAARNAHIVTVSRALRQPTIEFLQLSPSRVTTILNPALGDIPLATDSGTVQLHRWLQDKRIPTLIAVGRLEHEKGFDVLIDAFATMRQHTEARLLIFGQGSLHARLQAQIDAHGLNDAITLAGHTRHPLAQMRAADAFVLSSRFEGFGLVLVEALWAGTQVIATDCNYGPAELLEQGRYGTLVPVENVQALADAMLASVQNPRVHARPPENWFTRFTATEAAHQHIALIESIKTGGGAKAD